MFSNKTLNIIKCYQIRLYTVIVSMVLSGHRFYFLFVDSLVSVYLILKHEKNPAHLSFHFFYE